MVCKLVVDNNPKCKYLNSNGILSGKYGTMELINKIKTKGHCVKIFQEMTDKEMKFNYNDLKLRKMDKELFIEVINIHIGVAIDDH